MKIISIALSVLLAFSGLSVVAMQGPTYYDILGVEKDADLETITKAYRSAALEMHPDKKPSDFATKKTQALNDAYNVLKDADARQKYDQFIAGNQQPAAGSDTHFAGRNTDVQDHVMLLAGIFGAKKAFGYAIHAWDQYTMQKNFAAVKEHAQLQLKNKQKNKPIVPMREALDLTWVMQLRHGQKPSPIEQAIDQFDKLAIQNPTLLPAAGIQLVRMTDVYSNAIGSSTTSLCKAAAIVGAGAVGYLTSDKWLPQLLNSRLFYIALRLFS